MTMKQKALEAQHQEALRCERALQKEIDEVKREAKNLLYFINTAKSRREYRQIAASRRANRHDRLIRNLLNRMIKEI